MRPRVLFNKLGYFLSLIRGKLGGFSVKIKITAQTEVAKVHDRSAGGKSSSSVRQRRAPVPSGYTYACVTIVHQNVAPLLGVMAENHKRSTRHWNIGWIIIPEIFLLSADALNQVRFPNGGLQVSPVRTRANFDLDKELSMSDTVVRLGWAFNWQSPQGLFCGICCKAIAGRSSFRDLLARCPEIKPHLGRGALVPLVGPASCNSLAGEIANNVLGQRKAYQRTRRRLA